MLWKYETEGPIRSSLALLKVIHIFIGSDDGYLHAVNPNSGKRTWRVDAGNSIRSTPFITKEDIFFGCETGDILCVDFRGQTRWRFRAKREMISSLIVSQVLYT